MLFVVVYFVFSVDAFFMEKILKQNHLFWLFWKKPKKPILFCNFLHEKCFDRKKQSTPRQRARKYEEDGSHPESGLILHRSCVIYDGGRPPETGHVTKSRLLIGQPQEMVPQHCGKAPPPSAEGAARPNRSYGNQNLTHKVSCNLPWASGKVVPLCL